MVLDHCYPEESLASATDGLLAASSTSVESLFYLEFYIELEPFSLLNLLLSRPCFNMLIECKLDPMMQDRFES